MANEFTPNLYEPRNQKGSLPVVNVQQPSNNSLADTINAVGKITDVGLKAAEVGYGILDKRETADALAYVEQGLDDVFGQAAATEPTLDPQVEGSLKDVNKLALAKEQNTMSESDAVLRAKTVIKKAIELHPEKASEIRQRAQQILGFVPSQRDLELRFEEERFQKKQDQAARASMAQTAVQAGIYYPDDPERTVEAGRKILEQNYKLDLLKQQKAMLPSTEEVRAQTQSTLFEAADSVYEQYINSAVKRYNHMYRTKGGQLQQQDLEEISNAATALQVQFNRQLQSAFNQVNADAQTRQAVMNYYAPQFDYLKNLASGDQSAAASTMRVLEEAEGMVKLRGVRMMPTIFAMNQFFGADATASMVNRAKLFQPAEQKERFQREIQGGFYGMEYMFSPEELRLHNFNAMIDGTYKYQNIPAKDKNQAISDAVNGLKSQGMNISKANDTALQSYGNLLDIVADASTESTSYNHINTFNDRDIQKGFDTFVAADGNAQKGKELAEKIVDSSTEDLKEIVQQNSLTYNARIKKFDDSSSAGKIANRILELFGYFGKYDDRVKDLPRYLDERGVYDIGEETLPREGEVKEQPIARTRAVAD